MRAQFLNLDLFLRRQRTPLGSVCTSVLSQFYSITSIWTVDVLRHLSFCFALLNTLEKPSKHLERQCVQWFHVGKLVNTHPDDHVKILHVLSPVSQVLSNTDSAMAFNSLHYYPYALEQGLLHSQLPQLSVKQRMKFGTIFRAFVFCAFCGRAIARGIKLTTNWSSMCQPQNFSFLSLLASKCSSKGHPVGKMYPSWKVPSLLQHVQSSFSLAEGMYYTKAALTTSSKDKLSLILAAHLLRVWQLGIDKLEFSHWTIIIEAQNGWLSRDSNANRTYIAWIFPPSQKPWESGNDSNLDLHPREKSFLLYETSFFPSPFCLQDLNFSFPKQLRILFLDVLFILCHSTPTTEVPLVLHFLPASYTWSVHSCAALYTAYVLTFRHFTSAGYQKQIAIAHFSYFLTHP